MDQTKPALASTGVWGSAIAILGALAPAVLSAAGLRDVLDQQAVASTAMQLFTGFGAALALYGRLTATKRIG